VAKRTLLREAGVGAAVPEVPAEVSALQYRPAKRTVAPAGSARLARLELNVDASVSTSTLRIAKSPLVAVPDPFRAAVHPVVVPQVSSELAAIVTCPRSLAA
jgi:hypothetical protein